VQLESSGGSLRGTLIAASCALLGSAPVARAQTHDLRDTLYRALADWQLDFNFTFDSLSGSSPNGALRSRSCTEAGLLATLAVLNGKDAEKFLEQQAARCRVFR
jgi:hypothetical protein